MTDAYEGAQIFFAKDMSFGDYLSLDPILGAQNCQSDAHDEMLFIIQHQTSELWMRLALHELSTACDHLVAGDFQPAFKMLARVSRIFEQLNNAWDVLRTMTPSEYTAFREDLGASSGFQSHQYRLIEFILGNRNNAMLNVHEHRPELHRMRVGTPPVLQLSALEAALRVWDGVDMQHLRDRSIASSELFIAEVEERCPALTLASPRDPALRGSQVSFAFEHGYVAMQALIACDVIGDFRAPDIMRFGFIPLYLDESDVRRAVDVLADVLDNRLWDNPDYKQACRVT